jgi:archaellum component FlaG (FlaF/FlaG flagellin family)
MSSKSPRSSLVAFVVAILVSAVVSTAGPIVGGIRWTA